MAPDPRLPPMRALALAALALLPAWAGCAEPEDARANLVPYPRLGDVATYEATGAMLDLARWENAHPFATGRGQVVWEVGAGGEALDAARAVHETFRVTRRVGDGAAPVEHAQLFVAPAFQGVIQSSYKLSQDQAVLAFDERGYPWLWGASALFGEELRLGQGIRVPLPDNLGAGRGTALAWVPEAREEDGTWRLNLTGHASVEGTLWMEPGNAWPARVELTLKDAGLAPLLRADAALPARIEARRASLVEGAEAVPPRNRDASFAEDAGAKRAAWDGEKPPDGDAGYVPYLLADAVRDAKLLDAGLREWLEGADDPRLYRGTYKRVPLAAGPVNVSDQSAPYWLLQFMEKGGSYYEVQVERVDPPAAPAPAPVPLAPGGVPRVVASGPAEPPTDPNHGWFPRDAPPGEMVTLSEAVRVVREVFGATQVEIFLRSFASPPGYSYYVDGGMEPGGVGRYTVVYNPATGLIEGATGPVTPRVS